MTPNLQQPASRWLNQLGQKLKNVKDESAVMILVGVAVGAFGAGIGAYQLGLEVSNSEPINKDYKEELKEKVKLYELENTNLKLEIEKLKSELGKNASAKIQIPFDGSKIKPNNNILVVKGEAYKGKSPNQHFWLVIRPINSGDWYPNDEIVLKSDGSWEQEIYLADQGQFEINVILTDRIAHNELSKYRDTNKKTNEYRPISLPSNVSILDKAIITTY
ncbi:hypothetical protein F7734_47845 [Scytonema sp. UIC 10036]|uniref:bZIP transcription factor n=1 Tax=Scytonema sp. UIC 10036 TaxID=2304196 RepID=UPI0012DA02EB|nr:bZIP transcription factor [Scytonema sp. UIC 10036]MUG99590.1 hypothetical protein [Scytonema sp. UIC 10036]